MGNQSSFLPSALIEQSLQNPQVRQMQTQFQSPVPLCYGLVLGSLYPDGEPVPKAHKQSSVFLPMPKLSCHEAGSLDLNTRCRLPAGWLWVSLSHSLSELQCFSVR